MTRGLTDTGTLPSLVPAAAPRVAEDTQLAAAIPGLPTTLPAAGVAADLAGSVHLNPSRFSYRMLVAYDGTNYSGFQLQPQPEVATVQRSIEAALCTLLQVPREKLGVMAAGRTDSGVHAKGQVVQFYADKHLDVSKIPRRMCALLPPDICVYACSATAPDFHVSISALKKVYHYWVDTNPIHDPLLHRFRLHHKHPLKGLQAMRAAARLFVGEHDFMQFTNTRFDKEGKNKSTIKTVLRVDIVLLGPEGDVVQVYRSQDGTAEEKAAGKEAAPRDGPAEEKAAGKEAAQRDGPEGDIVQVYHSQGGTAEEGVAGNQAATSNGDPGGGRGGGYTSSSIDQGHDPQQHQSRHVGYADPQSGACVHERLADSSSDGVEVCSSGHHSSSSSSSSDESYAPTLASPMQGLTYPHPDRFSGVRIEVEGEGFLFRQVRHMAGALLAVGSGKLTVGELEQKLRVGGREGPGQGGRYRGWKVAEAKGLMLHSVQYPPEADDPTRLLYPGLTAEDNQLRLLQHKAE